MRRAIAASAIALLLGGIAVAKPAAAATPEPGSIGASGTITYPVENISIRIAVKEKKLPLPRSSDGVLQEA